MRSWGTRNVCVISRWIASQRVGKGSLEGQMDECGAEGDDVEVFDN